MQNFALHNEVKGGFLVNFRKNRFPTNERKILCILFAIQLASTILLTFWEIFRLCLAEIATLARKHSLHSATNENRLRPAVSGKVIGIGYLAAPFKTERYTHKYSCRMPEDKKKVAYKVFTGVFHKRVERRAVELITDCGFRKNRSDLFDVVTVVSELEYSLMFLFSLVLLHIEMKKQILERLH